MSGDGVSYRLTNTATALVVTSVHSHPRTVLRRLAPAFPTHGLPPWAVSLDVLSLRSQSPPSSAQ